LPLGQADILDPAGTQNVGTGQFRPGQNANPNIGSVGELESIEEIRVETLCVGKDVAQKAVVALKR